MPKLKHCAILFTKKNNVLEEQIMIHFDLPKEQSSIIKVIGVGGGGSNAVNHMFSQNIEGVNLDRKSVV